MALALEQADYLGLKFDSKNIFLGVKNKYRVVLGTEVLTGGGENGDLLGLMGEMGIPEEKYTLNSLPVM